MTNSDLITVFHACLQTQFWNFTLSSLLDIALFIGGKYALTDCISVLSASESSSKSNIKWKCLEVSREGGHLHIKKQYIRILDHINPLLLGNPKRGT